MLKRSFIRVMLKLPWNNSELRSEISLDDGTAELWFRARGQAKNEQERRDHSEERTWRIREISARIAAGMLAEIEKDEKNHGR